MKFRETKVLVIKNLKINLDSKSAGSIWSEKRYDIKKNGLDLQ